MSRKMAVAAVAGLAVLLGGASWWGWGRIWGNRSAPTFRREIAPVVYTSCAECHAPGGMAPFSLLSYADAKKHAREMAEVTASGFMPPWLPAPGSGFLGERRLSASQIASFSAWAKAGAPEGEGAAPSPPPAHDGWRLGTPDLVVEMPSTYTLPAEGRDVYRNFAVPVPLAGPRYVRAVELRPNNPRAVHHAFLAFDSTGESRRLDGRDGQPGFGGMSAGSGAANPGSTFLSWQPGAAPLQEVAGAQWPLAPGTDAVFQLHLRPTGKEEPIVMSAAFYFTDEPPKFLPFRLLLRSTAIDIPPGDPAYAVDAAYQLPVDVAVLAVLPHAHYLGHELKGWADLPDGSRIPILEIPRWDFNWQGAYRFAQPRKIPKGATLRMHFTYDNSAANPFNRGRQPVRVQFGEQTSDEMAELWLQVATLHPGDRQILQDDYVKNWAAPDSIARALRILKQNPKDVATRANLGAIYAVIGRVEDAILELQKAVEIDPNYAPAHAHLGQTYLTRGDTSPAKAEFEQAIELDPEDYKSRNNLGYILLATGNPQAAAEQFERVLRAHPDEALARKNLERAGIAIKAREKVEK